MNIWIIDLATGQKKIVDDYEDLSWEERYSTPSPFTLKMTTNQFVSAGVEKGKLLVVEDQAYLIQQWSYEGAEASDLFEITGLEIGGKFEDRIILPDAGQSHDSVVTAAETAMKHYVRRHAGDLAVLARRLPSFSVAADLGRGLGVSFQGRYQTLSKVLSDLSAIGDLGWRVSANLSVLPIVFVFDVIAGTDRSASVFLDFEFETAMKQKWLSTDLGRKNWGLAAGQGEGAAREEEIVWVGVAEPTGLDRKEMFIDARDLSQESSLSDRALAKLLETIAEDVFEVEINPDGSFPYGQAFFLGDIVTIRNTDLGIQASARVVSVKNSVSSSSPAITRTVEVGRAFPTLKSKLMKDTGTERS